MILPLPGNDLANVHVGTAFLKAACKGNPLSVAGNDVVVLGAGNAAFDCARTAVRLGAKSVTVAFRKAHDQLTSSPEERAEAVEEGVKLFDRCSFEEIVDDGRGGVAGFRVQRIARLAFDGAGHASVEREEGLEEVLPADCIIFAVGQTPEVTDEMGIDLADGRHVAVGDDGQTSVPGVFAAGDAVTKTSSVIEAIAQGRAAASAIDRFLGGDGDIEEQLVDSQPTPCKLGSAPDVFFQCALEPELMNAEERSCTFDPFERPFSEKAAIAESSRCLQCDVVWESPARVCGTSFRSRHGLCSRSGK